MKRMLCVVAVLLAPAAAGADPLTLYLPSMVRVPAGQPLGFPLLAAGGQQPYAFRFDSDVPAWLTLVGSSFSADAPVAGTTELRICTTDAAGADTCGTTQLVIVDDSELRIEPASLPAGQVGVDYLTVIRASGGHAPYSFTLTNPPAGLAWAGRPPTSAELKGVPSQAGVFLVNVTVSDASDREIPSQLPLRIAAGALPPTILTTKLPDATMGVPYTTSLEASAPAQWRTAAGATVPAGLTLDAEGVLSGTPAGPEGQFAIAVVATVAVDGTQASTPWVIHLKVVAPEATGGSGWSGPSPTANKDTGCSCTSGPDAPSFLALLAWAAFAARRRASR